MIDGFEYGLGDETIFAGIFVNVKSFAG